MPKVAFNICTERENGTRPNQPACMSPKIAELWDENNENTKIYDILLPEDARIWTQNTSKDRLSAGFSSDQLLELTGLTQTPSLD